MRQICKLRFNNLPAAAVASSQREMSSRSTLSSVNDLMPLLMCPPAHSYCMRDFTPMSVREAHHRSISHDSVPLLVEISPVEAAEDAAAFAARFEGYVPICRGRGACFGVDAVDAHDPFVALLTHRRSALGLSSPSCSPAFSKRATKQLAAQLHWKPSDTGSVASKRFDTSVIHRLRNA